MHKKTIKGFFMGILTTVMLLTSFSVFAASDSINKKIDVIFNNIKIAVDGKSVDLGKDSSGKKIEPFIYNGSTYLPVQEVAKVLGERVYWDGKQQTVYIGERPGELKYLTEVLSAYAGNAKESKLNDTKYPVTMAGNNYKTVYLFTVGQHNLFNFNSKYSSLTFDIGVSKYHELFNYGSMNIYLDGELYKTMKFKADSMPEKVTIPLKGVNQLKFESKYEDGLNFTIGIGDPILK